MRRDMEMVAGRYFLAFDHRQTFERLVHEGGPSRNTTAAIIDAKETIFDGVELAAEAVPVSRISILVDGRYCGEVPRRARRLGVTLAMPIGLDDRGGLSLDAEERLPEQIAAADPDIVKALVSQNIEGDRRALDPQVEELGRLSARLSSEGREFLLTLLVPPTTTQLDRAGGDPGRFARESRGLLISRSIERLREAGVEPTTWKVEPLHSRADAEEVVAAARRGRTAPVDCVLLSGGAPTVEVNRHLRLVASVDGFVGFSIGRSIWATPIHAYLSGALSRSTAARRVASAYERFVDVYADPRPAGAC